MKINIGVEIGGSTRTAAEKINAAIQEVALSDIVLDESGNSTCHVTIVMGDVADKRRSTLEKIVSDHAASNGAFRLEFGQPYRETVTGRYVFADVIDPASFLLFRSELQEAVVPLFESVARISAVPHLTLAHVESNHDAVDRLLARERRLPPSEVSHLDIALGGSKGRRLDLLKSFSLVRSA